MHTLAPRASGGVLALHRAPRTSSARAPPASSRPRGLRWSWFQGVGAGGPGASGAAAGRADALHRVRAGWEPRSLHPLRQMPPELRVSEGPGSPEPLAPQPLEVTSQCPRVLGGGARPARTRPARAGLENRPTPTTEDSPQLPLSPSVTPGLRRHRSAQRAGPSLPRQVWLGPRRGVLHCFSACSPDTGTGVLQHTEGSAQGRQDTVEGAWDPDTTGRPASPGPPSLWLKLPPARAFSAAAEPPSW